MDEELANVEAELRQAEEQIAQLRQRRQNLHRRKAEVNVRHSYFLVCSFQIEARLQERAVNSASRSGQWDSDDYQWSSQLRALLKDTFRINDFRPLQRAAMNAVLSKEDAILIMSTGLVQKMYPR